MDNLLVKSKLPTQHIKDLKEASITLKRYNMCLNPLKYVFGAGFEKFLRFIITTKDIKMNLDKLKTILEMLSPRNVEV